MFWLDYPYVRTSSREFDSNVDDPTVHLTNDAVQKGDQDYGKFEEANKVSLQKLDSYFKSPKYKEKGKAEVLIVERVLPRIKELSTELVKSIEYKFQQYYRAEAGNEEVETV